MRLLTILALIVGASSAHAATFGDQTAYTGSLSVRDNILAAPASPAQSGVCDSVTGLFRFTFDSSKVRCALYTLSGADTVLVANGITVERRFEANGALVWYGLAFADPKPTVTAGQTYFIAIFSDSAGSGGSGTARIASSTTGGNLIARTHNYESGYPATLNPITSTSASRISAYVTFTPVSTIPPRRRNLCRP